MSKKEKKKKQGVTLVVRELCQKIKNEKTNKQNREKDHCARIML